MANHIRYLAGIDEAGRGPLAGPVAVGVAMCAVRDLPKLRREWRGVKDAKRLTPVGREIWFARLRDLRRRGLMEFFVSLVGEATIDRRGINRAIWLGIRRCLRRAAANPSRTMVLLDGGLKAPRPFLWQKTIIRGDESEPLIALASIAAKVRRDRRLVRLSRLYPRYGFEIHKGYGTRRHYAALRAHGLSPLHRRSFLKNLLKKKTRSSE